MTSEEQETSILALLNALPEPIPLTVEQFEALLADHYAGLKQKEQEFLVTTRI